MFESTAGSALMTWRSPAWPITTTTRLIRLDDHRAAYLDYEGPLSDNRGQVTRVASGAFTIESRTDATLDIALHTGHRYRIHNPAGPSAIEPLAPLA